MITLPRPADLHKRRDANVRIADAYFASDERSIPDRFGRDDTQTLMTDVLGASRNINGREWLAALEVR